LIIIQSKKFHIRLYENNGFGIISEIKPKIYKINKKFRNIKYKIYDAGYFKLNKPFLDFHI